MTMKTKALLLAFGATLLSACPPAPKAPAAASEIATVASTVFQRDEDDWPTWASGLGERRYDALWDDLSKEARLRREAFDRETLARLRRVDRRALDREDAITFDVLERRLGLAVAAEKLPLHLFPVNQRDGIQTVAELSESLPFETSKNYEDWNTRLRTFGHYMDQVLALLEEGARTGVTHPRIIMERVTSQIDAQLVDAPEKSPFFGPYRRMPKTMPPAERARLEADARSAITDVVVPAFRRMRRVWTEVYLPACKPGVGIHQIPNGDAVYDHLVRVYTTRNISPEEVHALGLKEVSRIRGEMERVRAQLGTHPTLAALFEEMKTSPRFFERDPERLLGRYRELAKRIDPLLPKLFSKLPRIPYGVSAIPDIEAPHTTTAYYREPASDGTRAGMYTVNLYKPETRPLWEMTALTLHESVPGHHLQIALAIENDAIPPVRRHENASAFIEGWALYAESLGDELGLYDDPYSKLGQLNYEMWRAVRLVVDTGMHRLRWDRERAIAYFRENTARAELDIANEVDRYAAWPGQALAYKIGELAIKELRRKREAALGARFDVRAFHAQVLGEGPLPLDVLERVVLESP